MKATRAANGTSIRILGAAIIWAQTLGGIFRRPILLLSASSKVGLVGSKLFRAAAKRVSNMRWDG